MRTSIVVGPTGNGFCLSRIDDATLTESIGDQARGKMYLDSSSLWDTVPRCCCKPHGSCTRMQSRESDNQIPGWRTRDLALETQYVQRIQGPGMGSSPEET